MVPVPYPLAPNPDSRKLTSLRSTTGRVEKYRPIYLDDIVGNTETIERLKIIARDGNMPHLIISGMPGIGKTTSILCLARQLLGDAYKEAVLELNASDERGGQDTCLVWLVAGVALLRRDAAWV